MKLWQGRFEGATDPIFERLNRSLDTDAVLLDVDIQGSRAWATALYRCGVLTEDECVAIRTGLARILETVTPDQVKAAPFEDVHTFVEATLTAEIGEVGRKLHTGRSRNDQVATDFRLFVRKAIDLVNTDIDALLLSLDRSASEFRGVLIPAYTHLRRAQPVTWPHYCGAYRAMFERDRERLIQCRARVDVMPLGSGAVAGTNFPIDRKALAADLGFARISENSMDATCDRDFVAEFLSSSALLLVHASRLAEDWIIYSSDEFGFLLLSDSVTSGSSLMPQKKNPDGLELIRAKAAMTIGLQTGFMALLKGLPSAYNKDLQEDKAAFLTAFDNVRLSLALLALTIRTAVLRPDRLLDAVSDSFMAATDLADFLVQHGVPFRTAHEIVGTAVRQALGAGLQLNQIDLTAHSPHFADLPVGFFSPEALVRRKVTPGGTGSS